MIGSVSAEELEAARADALGKFDSQKVGAAATACPVSTEENAKRCNRNCEEKRVWQDSRR
jgi:hypothetical protein